MARAEYLKEQVKVGTWWDPLGQGYVGSDPLLVAFCLPFPPVCVSLSKGLSIAVSFTSSCSVAVDAAPLPAPGCLSPLCCLSVPQMRESRWEADTLDKEGLLESVRSCESCPEVPPSAQGGVRPKSSPGFCIFCQRPDTDPPSLPLHSLHPAVTLKG